MSRALDAMAALEGGAAQIATSSGWSGTTGFGLRRWHRAFASQNASALPWLASRRSRRRCEPARWPVRVVRTPDSHRHRWFRTRTATDLRRPRAVGQGSQLTFLDNADSDGITRRETACAVTWGGHLSRSCRSRGRPPTPSTSARCRGRLRGGRPGLLESRSGDYGARDGARLACRTRGLAGPLPHLGVGRREDVDHVGRRPAPARRCGRRHHRGPQRRGGDGPKPRVSASLVRNPAALWR